MATVMLIGLVVWTIAGLRSVIVYMLEAILWHEGARSKTWLPDLQLRLSIVL
jgi:hypothetical protein